MIQKPQNKIEWFLLIIILIAAISVFLVIVAGTFNKLGTW